jgi:hypothetical protein
VAGGVRPHPPSGDNVVADMHGITRPLATASVGSGGHRWASSFPLQMHPCSSSQRRRNSSSASLLFSHHRAGGDVPVLAVGTPGWGSDVLGPQPSVSMFWSRGVSFRSGPKIATHIGPLL